MRTILAGIVLVAVVAATTHIAPTPTQAQEKKDKGKPKKGGTIEIALGKDDKFRFFVRDSEGKLLALSGPGGFATEKDAHDAIDHLKEVLASAKITTKKPDKDKDKSDK